MSNFLDLNASDILFIIAVFFGLIGTLLIMYAQKHTVKTIVETPINYLPPTFIEGNDIIDPKLIAKRKFYDPNNRKMSRIKKLGIFLLILVPLITVWAIILVKK